MFLDRVKDDFMQLYGASINEGESHPLADDLFEDRFSIAYNLDREFGYLLLICAGQNLLPSF